MRTDPPPAAQDVRAFVSRAVVSTFLLLPLVLSACDRVSTAGAEDPIDPAARPASKAVTVLLSPGARLARAAMALEGKRPSLEDLRRVAEDASRIESLVDQYLASPEFGATMRELHNEALLVRTDFNGFPAGFAPKDPIADLRTADVNGSLMEAPLALIEYIIVHDRPYTEIVTADYTLANEIVAAVWGDMPYASDGPEWQITRRYDERGNAGVLSDSWLFTRHTTTVSNANRGRANAVARAFLCYDFLDRTVAVDTNIDFADPRAVQSAVNSNAACASCHQTLDPLAAFFEGYHPIYVPGQIQYPFTDFYYPGLLARIGGTVESPSYFGKAGTTLQDLGRLMAEDPRFSLCAAKRFYAFFHQVGLADVPEGRARELQDAFIGSGYSAKALARTIVLADDFNAAYSNDEEIAESTIGVKRASAEQLARLVEDLTGFRWTATTQEGRIDLSVDSYYGYKVLAGGIDAFNVTLPSRTFNATSNLFLFELARRAAAYVVESDSAEPEASKRRLLKWALDDRDEGRTREALADLHLRILAEERLEDSVEVLETYDLFEAALSQSGDVKTAWQAVLTAMLQDFRVATY